MDAKTRFEQAIGNRKCVIELGLAREVADRKTVKPIERKGTAVCASDDVDAQLLSEHEVNIPAPTVQRTMQQIPCRCRISELELGLYMILRLGGPSSLSQSPAAYRIHQTLR